MKNKCLFALVIMFFSLCNTLFAHRPDGRLRSCISNIRNIYGAIEMYNMDNIEHFTKLDEDGFKLLKKGHYLKEITKPEFKEEIKAEPENETKDKELRIALHCQNKNKYVRERYCKGRLVEVQINS